VHPRPLALAGISATFACSASRSTPDAPALPGGWFDMGSPDGEGDADEHPRHRVHVAPFALGAHEVTVAEYAECVRAARCASAPTVADWPGITDADRKQWSPYCNGDRADRREHPVNCVDWTQASAYCAFVGERLPTEEEWEYAARGVEGRAYPWGNDAPSATRMNGCGSECAAAFPGWKAAYGGDDGWVATAPVGSYPAGRTPSGLWDMAGNVWEWTSSGASSDYAHARADDSRIDRGGSWHAGPASEWRGAKRDSTGPSVRGPILGFRCAR
jgi:formylglycine-generating enzyme required for sulfatase activity